MREPGVVPNETPPKSSVLFVSPLRLVVVSGFAAFHGCLRASCVRIRNGPKDKAREVKAASELVARETAQQKADGVMKCVVKAQDRLIGALQAEVGMTNRAREAAEVRYIALQCCLSLSYPKLKLHGKYFGGRSALGFGLPKGNI